MLVRYLPGKFDEKIPLPVQKKVTAHGREGESEETLVFELDGGRREQVNLALCFPLLSGEKKIRTWLKMAGLFILLIGFCAGTYNIAVKIFSGGFSGIDILEVIQFIVSLALVGYISWIFKITVERYLYGGISFDGGEIFFQSDAEKTMFNDILKNKKREAA